MSGYKIVIPTTFTNSSLPVLRDDPILSPGSLVLVEPGHPVSTYSGSLANGDLLDNIAWKEAAKLTGGTQTSLKSRFERGSRAKAWWSAKGNSIQWVGGGAAGVGGLDRVGAHFAIPVLQYLRDNPDHAYVAILWSGLAEGTPGLSGRWSHVHFDAAQSSTSAYYAMTAADSGNINSSGAPISNTNTAVGHRRTVSLANGYTAPLTATATEADFWSRLFGNIAPAGGPSGGQAIFHRFYMEDLTVSGRTSSEVQEADAALYVKEMLKPGGRHYGESYAAKV